MSRPFWLALGAFLSHWRRHPLQLAALLVGLAAATALWSGVQALNGEAKRSYERAAAFAGGEGAANLSAPGGGRFSIALFAELRRAGWKVSPVLEGSVLLAGDPPRFLRVIGIEPLTLPAGSSFRGEDAASLGGPAADAAAALAFIRPPWRAYAAPETLRELQIEPGARLALADGGETPAILVSDAAPPGALVVDLGAAEALLDAAGEADRLLLDRGAAPPEAPLEALLRGRLALSEPPENDFNRLTSSLHLNLTAFGFLSFVVGLFIAYAAIGLAFEQRRAVLRTVRALGVSARTAAAALLAEMMGAALIAGAAGLALGYWIAGALAPDVAATLRGLYGAPAAGSLRFDPIWALAGLGMGMAGALAAAAQSLWKAYRMPLLSSVGAEAWRAAQSRWLARQGAAGAALLLLAAALIAAFAAGAVSGLGAAFILLGALLLGAALALPALLDLALALGRRTARGPAALWFWADARREISGLSLALAALLLALAANIGVGTMVGGFRDAFQSWLDARLAPELYAQGRSDAEAAEMRAWAAGRPEVRAVLPEWTAETRLEGWPVQLRGVTNAATYRDSWPLLEAQDGVWRALATGRTALISEQLGRRLGVGLGDEVEIPAADGPWRATVVGVYADYGNPRGQIVLDLETLAERVPNLDRRRFELRVAPKDVEALQAELVRRFQLGAADVIDQTALKALATQFFERTFSVTSALSVLTLAVAGVALLASLAGMSGRRLARLAPLWALGMSRGRLAALDMGQTLALALGAAALAIPLGAALAWVLVAVVNVEAFGWRLPFVAFPLDWLRLALVALLAAAAASAPGYVRLRRTPPDRLLRLLSEER